MVRVEYCERELQVQPGESLLDALLRHGVRISHSCKAGACQSCLLRAVGGSVPDRAQEPLKDTLREQGYFLACCCYPTGDLTVLPPGDEQRTPARIVDLQPLNDTVVRVRLVPERGMDYRAGQFFTLLRKDGLARSYSIASLPAETEIEFHVRQVPNGAMSSWLFSTAALNADVWLQGPAGACFYVPGNPQQSIICVGSGTGLAPLYGIVRDALAQGHTGPLWLFHAATEPSGLYLVEALMQLADTFHNFHYARSVLRGEGTGATVGPVEEHIAATIPDLKGWKGFVCGGPGFVNSMKMKLFLAGIASRSIYSDSFIPTAG